MATQGTVATQGVEGRQVVQVDAGKIKRDCFAAWVALTSVLKPRGTVMTLDKGSVNEVIKLGSTFIRIRSATTGGVAVLTYRNFETAWRELTTRGRFSPHEHEREICDSRLAALLAMLPYVEYSLKPTTLWLCERSTHPLGTTRMRPAGKPAKVWAARFAKATDPRAEAFTAAIDVDRRLYKQDVAGSIAHARMLARQGIIPAADAEAIVRGLEEIRQEIETGRFVFRRELEDVHMNIEVALREKIGEAADWLHTARSRNDQIATDLRLYLKEAIGDVLAALRRLQGALVDLAEANREVIMPGYTHLQRAQPVLFAHHLLAYFEMLDRDAGRLRDCLSRADELPLGAGALAGVPYPIDREFVARELGFARTAENSIDAVSDRDCVAEFQAAAAITMMHLSRLCEELVLWSSAEFTFVQLDEAFAGGSSIMPQKRNPDVAELARAKTGRVYGNLMGILTLLKGLPLAYGLDLQEDKAGLFDSVDTLLATLDVLAAMLPSLRVNAERMAAAASEGYTLATDLADYLAQRGLPFRQAHEAVGRLVRYAEGQGKALSELSLEEYRRFSPLFEGDVFGRLDVRTAVEARDVPGGTSLRRVTAALKRARRRLEGQGS